MGFFGAVKRFFSGTRKANQVRLFNSISPEPKRSASAKRMTVKRVSTAERKAREQRSTAWKEEQAKKELKKEEERKAQSRKAGEALQQAIQHSKKEEAREAKKRKKESNAYFNKIMNNLERNKKEAARAQPTNEWDRAFAASLARLERGEKPQPNAAYAAKGNVKLPGAKANRSVGPKSIRVRNNNWEQIPVNRTNVFVPAATKAAVDAAKRSPTKKGYTRANIEKNLAGLFLPPIKKLPHPPAGRTRKRVAVSNVKGTTAFDL